MKVHRIIYALSVSTMIKSPTSDEKGVCVRNNTGETGAFQSGFLTVSEKKIK